MLTTDDERVARAALAQLATHAPRFTGLEAPGEATAPSARSSRARTILVAAAVAGGILGSVALATSLNSDQGRETSPAPADGTTVSPRTTPTADSPGLPARDAVRAVAEDLSLPDADGFGKVSVDFKSGTVTVFWQGEPPAKITDAAGRTVNGVKVVLIPTDFSEKTLVDAGKTILAAGSELGTTVFAVRPNNDLSGVVASVDSVVDAQHLVDRLQAIAGVPVQLESGGPGFEQPRS